MSNLPTPPRLFRRSSPSPDPSPIELEMASPPILRAHTSHLIPDARPISSISPSDSRSVSSETSSVSATLRPRSSSPNYRDIVMDDVGEIDSRRAKSFSPHSGDLIGSRFRRHNPTSAGGESQVVRHRRPNLNNLLQHNSSEESSLMMQSGSPSTSSPYPQPHSSWLLPRPVIRPRVSPEPPHLADFDRRSAGAGGFNELGLPVESFRPTAFRPRQEFVPTNEVSDHRAPQEAEEEEEQDSSEPPVRALGPIPAAVPIFNLPTAESPANSPIPSIFLAYGLTGNHLRDTSSAVEATVPPPRQSRIRLSDRSRDRLDFSPPRPGQGQGYDREVQQGDMEQEGRSRHLQERLTRLDALRTEGGMPNSPSHWPNRITWDTGGTPSFPIGNMRSEAHDTASRLGRYNLDDDLRSRPRRRLSISDTDTEISGSGSEIGRWNRSVQDAVSRRIAAEGRSGSSISRGQREDSAPYSLRARLGAQANADTEAPYPQPSNLWGEVPRNAPQEDFPVRTIFGWRELSSNTDPFARLYSGRNSVDTDLVHPIPTPSVHARVDDYWGHRRYPFWSSDFLEPLSDENDPLPRIDVLSHLRLNQDMDEKEKARVFKIINRTVGLWPSPVRQKAAESVVENEKWGQMTVRQGMVKDESCSVCHDEYEDDSDVTVTPCNHMYHKGCLETWIQTPNTSTCPMCRRDLAVLACMTRITAEKKKEIALPLWLSI